MVFGVQSYKKRCIIKPIIMIIDYQLNFISEINDDGKVFHIPNNQLIPDRPHQVQEGVAIKQDPVT